LTLIGENRHTGVVAGSDGAHEDKALVDAVLQELRDAADKWELLVAEAENTTYSVDLGDVQAVANADGRLLELILGGRMTAEYTHDELTDRLNAVFSALRAEAEADNAARYGGELR